MLSSDGNKELNSITGESFANIRVIAQRAWQTVCSVRETALQLVSFPDFIFVQPEFHCCICLDEDPG
jgi:hypothetical protein